MNTPLLIIVLLVGIILLALEIVALPGGVAGICGTILLIWGVVESFTLWGATVGNIVLISCAVITALLLFIFMKSKTWKRYSLNEESDSTVNQVNENELTVGTRGTTVARLAPTGKALIDGKLIEVHAINKFIDPDRPIEIVAIEGYRIDVCEIEDKRFD